MTPESSRPYAPDLAAYFKRLGLSRVNAPTLESLHRIVFAHSTAIPFENIDVLLGLGIRLDPEAVEEKLVHRARGGYCFEHNSLLMHVLQALGYRVQPLSARVRLSRPRSMTPARTHMFLRVDIDGERYIVDVGVGAFSLTSALRLDTEELQHTPHESRRLLREGSWSRGDARPPEARIFHQVLLDDEWSDVCEMTLEPMPEIDREVANWFTSTHPKSHFLDQLLVARAAEKGRVSLLNRTLKFRGKNGRAEVLVAQEPAELLQMLAVHFGLELPAGTVIPCAGIDWSET